MASFVADGWTRTDGYIEAAVPGDSGERLYDALTFEYRPATRLECIKHDADVKIAMRNEDVDSECAIKAERLACEFVASHLVSWDLKNVGVHPVDKNAQSCERMQPFLFQRLYCIIRGTAVSDKKPEDKAEPKSDAELLKNS